ncbi:PREDICTED: CRAL-TRIO domain-containing protein C3H8.02 [Tarenaya hassleriana]|uniref:CRAL-TRIO domain-containing protein C3H8.02 n=1 Tax=Tarenaya hassleriana TaxID=28532 RepID=UPI00053C0E45|nr:PREDICTED: CRAL-TRIO domain-containing protein C3H8.02 [Tarenaya hassleriana]XP_010550685.1 PREDICTED: CRAL-TRIO domain-containing protein C3H8.02 [Tarenaya hassleriana]
MSIRIGSTLVAVNFRNSTNLSRNQPRSCRFSVRSCLSDSDQRKLVFEVKKRLARDYSILPLGMNGRDDEEMILWFLKDRRFSVEEAIGKLSKAIRWRQEFKVSELSEDSVKIAAETGKAYVHDSLDTRGRPVLTVVAAKHIPGLLDRIEDEKLCVFLLEKALSKLPAGQDKILGLFDLRGYGAENADIKFLTFLFDVFYCYYPSRLDEVLFVDAPFVFKPIWQFVKPLVKRYASLVKFCSSETVRKEYFTDETLPTSFKN